MIRHPLQGNVASDPVLGVLGRRLFPVYVDFPLHSYPVLRAMLAGRRRSSVFHVQLLRRSTPQTPLPELPTRPVDVVHVVLSAPTTVRDLPYRHQGIKVLGPARPGRPAAPPVPVPRADGAFDDAAEQPLEERGAGWEARADDGEARLDGGRGMRDDDGLADVVAAGALAGAVDYEEDESGYGGEDDAARDSVLASMDMLVWICSSRRIERICEVRTYLPPRRKTPVMASFLSRPICSLQTSCIGRATVSRSKTMLGTVMPM